MPELTRIGDRYDIRALLGSGGMASVYRVVDRATGREVALKQLRLGSRSEASATSVAALFEREFHTLKQLSHPRVIAVYYYGVDDGAPYYTMELLDGGDLQDRAPVPWRELCALLFDVCSSLALLHARRLLHRDISPRNVRCTPDGKAKLIDFGAMAPMSTGGAQVVGTPAFVPPETLHRLATDARADLFSLGVTFYAALTGHLPYPARTFAEVLSAWSMRPLPPSARVPDIPSTLDDLVLAMLNLEPARRPQSAFEVMQRLAAIAGLSASESDAVVAAYLATPQLVGRDDVVLQLQAAFARACEGHCLGALIRGSAGVGRSRVLDACATSALMQGAKVLHATGTGRSQPFLIIRTLLEAWLTESPDSELAQDYPELFAKELPSGRMQPRDFVADDASALHDTVYRFLLAASRAQPIVLAIDDVERVDSASASVLAALLDIKRSHAKLLVATSAENEAVGLTVEALSRRCESIELRPLTRDETQRLFRSVFGDASNLEMLTAEIHGIAAGNPRACMDLAQHLIDRGRIRYAAGGWTLPQQLQSDDLPRTHEAARQVRIAALSPQARVLAEAQALAFYQLFTLGDYRALLPCADLGEVDRAVSELVACGALIHGDGTYAFAHRLWSDAFKTGLDSESAVARHRALVDLYRGRASGALIHHAFAAGRGEEALAALRQRFTRHTGGVDYKSELEQNFTKLVPCYSKAVRAAIRLGGSARQVNELRRWAVAASLAAEGNHYWQEAAAWFKQLRHDTGLDLWQADAQNPNPGERLMRALGRAKTRFLETPEAERVYPADEAIPLLAEFVVCSIGIGARALDMRLLESLVPLLQPFAGLSPVLGGIHCNAMASWEAHVECLHERGRARWLDALAMLEGVTGAQMQHIDVMRNAIVYAIGMMEARCGMATAMDHAAQLDNDPYQKLSALGLRKIVMLEQGDFNAAERLRRQAEVLALQMRSPPMFQSLLIVELEAYADARDLAGMQQVIEAMKGPAATYPGWVPHLSEAQARFELVRGDLAAARLGFEECLRRVAIDATGRSECLPVWVRARAGLAETLFELFEIDAARQLATTSLRICDARGIESHAYDLIRTLALCEAKQGDYAAASARLEQLIAKQTAQRVTGLHLGVTLEARALIAIWGEDEAAFEHFARRTAAEYRHDARSPLGARYEQLVRAAMRSGFRVETELVDVEASTMIDAGTTSQRDVHGSVLRAMVGAQDSDGRAKRALRLICDAVGAPSGHLYVVTATGLTLIASRSSQPAPKMLREFAVEYVQRYCTASGTLTTIATGDLVEDATDIGSSVQANVAGVTYDFLALRCVVGGVNQLAGVAALVASDQHVRPIEHAQLLTTLAMHLVQAGDVRSLPARAG